MMFRLYFTCYVNEALRDICDVLKISVSVYLCVSLYSSVCVYLQLELLP